MFFIKAKATKLIDNSSYPEIVLCEIVDIDGGQVVDFFAEMRNHSDEFVSPGVTIDCNESLRLNVGDIIYIQ